jgi:hypothetical protein
VTWSGADPDQGYVSIFGEMSDESWAGSFSCLESADKGSFTVPWYVWAKAQRQIRLTVGIEAHWNRLRFEAPGLDIVHASYNVSSSKILKVEP